MRKGENFEEAVKVCFKNVPVKLVLKEEIKYNQFPQEHFHSLMINYLKEYSDTEIDSLYEWICKNFCERRNKNRIAYDEEGMDLFALVVWSARSILIQTNNEIECKYSELLRWRNLNNVLGEDLFICAYLADWSVRKGCPWREFEWGMTIPHNNTQLNRVLEKGLSDNHFHLYGSAPVAGLMWQAFMEDVCNRELLRLLQELDDERRHVNINYYGRYTEEPFKVQHLKAVLIRLYLMERLLEDSEKRNSSSVGKQELYYCLGNYKDLLQGTENIMDYREQIQDAVKLFREMYSSEQTRKKDAAEYGVFAFAEERRFLYQMFRKYRESGGQKWNWELNLFYAYLIIKCNFLGEISQNNYTIGFENFNILQSRKNVLFDLSMGKEHMVRQAIMGSMQSGNICSLEVRITPGNTFRESVNEIIQLDRLIIGTDIYQSDFKEKMEKAVCRKCPGLNSEWFFYVYHFIKSKDKRIDEEYLFENCRNYEARKRAEIQANAIVRMREQAPGVARRILGIDACAQELGCRPEVFGPVYRMLKKHKSDEHYLYEEVPQLRATYHVGEEFLDMVDGLRAIEEAVVFLNLCCGDRLGHATVLGLSVENWYASKRYFIHIPIQDHLDNIVWLYHKLIEYQIDDCEVLKDYLLKQFEKYFLEIYRKYINSEYLVHFSGGKEKRRVDWQFDIYTYYQAWKLRGDDPEFYRGEEGRWSFDSAFGEELLEFQYPDDDRIRDCMEAVLLYRMYHFDGNVKRAGAREEEIRIPSVYIEGVKRIQAEMQRFISIRGIGIETNPTSNLFISTMKAYKDHPIVNLYNKGLVWDVDQLKKCPQLFVSINTDDKGIFHTSLENEYSLIACELEKARDSDGRYLYNRQMIYDWLNSIRKMGNQQTFRGQH